MATEEPIQDGDRERFRSAGRALFSLGLVRDTEGNLSQWNGTTLVITRTGAALQRLAEADLVWGSMGEGPDAAGGLAGASSDLEVHRRLYARLGPGAVVHAHPAGSVPEGKVGAGAHGVYAFGRTLEEALGEAVRRGRVLASRAPAQAVPGAVIRPVEWLGDSLRILDQRALPREERYVTARDVRGVVRAIRSLAVRGAPLLGVVAGYGVALEGVHARALGPEPLLDALERAGRRLVAARPTAVNIQWAVDRILRAATDAVSEGAAVEAVRERAVAAARRIEAENADGCAAIGRLGSGLLPMGARVLTHCNTGALATGGMGTAQAVIVAAHDSGNPVHVWVDETRPVLQGARLTSWELGRLGVPMTLVADGAAGSLMSRGLVDAVVVGADRIAANGDTANKVGTYPLAVLARHHRIPFYVAAPLSTVDPGTPRGGEIPVEERDPKEVTAPFGVDIAPPGTVAANPAFDVTPARLITAIVTDGGMARPPYRASLARLRRADGAGGDADGAGGRA